MNEIWMNALIVYLEGWNPTLTSLKAYVMAQWNLTTDTQMFKHEEGYFVIKPSNREIRDSVLYT